MTSEFDFIHYIKKSFGLRAIGDDCAVLPKDNISDQVVTADLLVQGVDFRLDWLVPEQLGHKALAVSLSDIAAMGGQPVWALLTLGVPEKLWESDFLKRFYDGWTEIAREFGVELVGGDISRSRDLIIDSIVGGELPRNSAVLRSGAQPGDAVFVSGTLGCAAAGLKLLESAKEPAGSDPDVQRLIDRQLTPTPRIELGRLLRDKAIPTAMIDISDGLSSDIHHICEASNVGMRLDASLLPIDESLKSFFGADEALALALNGGEDFELLFSVPQKKISLLEKANVTRIGSVTENVGVVELNDGTSLLQLQPSGYRHF